MSDKDGFFAIRYYPVDGEQYPVDGEQGAIGSFRPASQNSAMVGLSDWFRAEDNPNPTMADRFGIGTPYRSPVSMSHLGGEEYGLNNTQFFDAAGLSTGQYVEHLVMLSDWSDEQLAPASHFLSFEMLPVLIVGMGLDPYLHETAISSDDPDPHNFYACGVFDVGVYTADVFSSLATFRVLGPYMEAMSDGSSWDNPLLPIPKNTFTKGGGGYFGVSLVGDVPEGHSNVYDDAGGGGGVDPINPDREGLVIRFYPVDGVDTSAYDFSALLGVGVWTLGDDDLSGPLHTMLAMGGSYERVRTTAWANPDSYYGWEYLSSIWYSDNSINEGRFAEIDIGLTKPHSSDFMDVTLPLEVYIAGVGPNTVYDPSDDSWVTPGSTFKTTAGVFEVGLYIAGEYFSLSALRIKGADFIPKPNGASWANVNIPASSKSAFLNNKGMLKTVLDIREEISGFWAQLDGTEEII